MVKAAKLARRRTITRWFLFDRIFALVLLGFAWSRAQVRQRFNISEGTLRGWTRWPRLVNPVNYLRSLLIINRIRRNDVMSIARIVGNYVINHNEDMRVPQAEVQNENIPEALMNVSVPTMSTVTLSVSMHDEDGKPYGNVEHPSNDIVPFDFQPPTSS